MSNPFLHYGCSRQIEHEITHSRKRGEEKTLNTAMPHTPIAAPFEIYEDPCDRIPTTPHSPRTEIDTLRTEIAEAEALLVKAVEVIEGARAAASAEQVMEAKEAVERIRLEKAIKREEGIGADLKMQIGIAETGMEYLSHTIEEFEEEIGELREEVERLGTKHERLVGKSGGRGF